MSYRDFRYIKTTICLMIAVSFFFACSSRLFTYKGSIVTQKNRMILLKQGEQHGVWKTNELAVTYQYQMTPEALKLSGTTSLVGGFAVGFNWINRLSVYLLFLDKQGIVIESPFLYSAGANLDVNAVPMDFEKTIPLPEGAWAISFAYEGELMGEGTGYSIWDSPSRP